ncbi:universal stress protein [filamentous cyanobacterium LEGE 11480]|uniref:Universal stress protein n=1 Tax=Romeriopsis navalis LEGE 11480 TaxID=2777977 RepID=A0A928VM34_9CYAN|nr:universal stress protein [Romeriopsis navalis]MBE9031123.1 universal stress protein [Romeriopsis navalis LEGE 11480]
MLARLQANLGVPHLAEQLLLIPPRPQHLAQELSAINLLVGYSHSESSQLALDLTLWIALQTRLATNTPVTVQVVYVTEEISPSVLQSSNTSKPFNPARKTSGSIATLAPAKVTAMNRADQFEQADRILWQARSLATEWRGSLKTHLRFGDVALELNQVAQAEAATLLILGCKSREDALIQRLGKKFPCAVLGIPDELEA